MGAVVHRFGVKIHFAHRTFKWSNEAKGVAAVHCVIIGFGLQEPERRTIFEYESPDGEAHAVSARNINAYLLDAPDVFLVNRSAPMSPVPAMRFGSMPRDGGHLILTDAEKAELLNREPQAVRFIRPYTGAEEYLNGYTRWCLWLVDASPEEMRRLPAVMERVEKVREFRLESKAATTRRFAETPSRFCQLAQPESDYLLVPRVSSERRRYIPVGFLSRNVIANDQVLTVTGATLYHFGVISSQMHMAWARQFCGRLKSDYRYSKDVVYNNFPWPDKPGGRQVSAIEAASQAVLHARAQYPRSSLADLYDPLTTPPELANEHRALDRAVDAMYGRKVFSSDSERVAFLLVLYQRQTTLFPTVRTKKR